ncbi:MAG: 3' terminal RNA ribose 2'-O-methyltransferase Hen1 [Bacteroidota bacterium]
MLLQITTTHRPATDLGYLLGKHPDRHQSRELAFGTAHIFYPEASPDRCTAVLMLEMNAVALSRRMRKQNKGSDLLEHYVNDRPYVASSFLSSAISRVFGSALNGTCKDRSALVDQALPLEARLPTIVSKGGEALIRQLFEPLGYELELTAYPLDPHFLEWGESPYFSLVLRHKITLKELLNHLFVLIPVLDNNKHYFVGEMEIGKLERHAITWLNGHPAQELIVRRYLKYKKSYARKFKEKMDERESTDAETALDNTLPEEKIEKTMNLHELRLQKVVEVLKNTGASTVVDLGCGGGKLLKHLIRVPQFKKIVGMDVSHRSLEVAHSRLYLRDASPAKKARIQLIHGSLTYRDDRLANFEAAALVEVIEHLDAERLEALERNIFQYARPRTLVLTTPNREYNVLFENMPQDRLRHADHRFEWTRSELQQWANRVAERYGYQVAFACIGPAHETHGSPSQMAVFSLKDALESTLSPQL